MNILILEKDERNKKFEIYKTNILWFGNINTTNNNRLFFDKTIKNVIIIFNSTKDNIFDLQKLLNICKLILKINTTNIIIYFITDDIKKSKNKEIINYLYENYEDKINVIINKKVELYDLIDDLY